MQTRQARTNPIQKTIEPALKMAHNRMGSTGQPAWTNAWGNRLPAGVVGPLADLQAKGVVSQPGDPYEQEAGQVADQVMHVAAPGAGGTPVPLGLPATPSQPAPSLSRAPSMIQRAEAEEGVASAETTAETAPAPAESTPASDMSTAEAASETTPPAEAPTMALIVDDATEQLGPRQMKKSDFLAQLRAAVCTTTEEALKGTIWSAAGCPWVEHWFGYYANRDSQQIERAIRRYAPETANATSAGDYIPIICERVRRAIAVWSTTGEVTGVPEGMELPGAGLMGVAGSIASGIASVGSTIASGAVSIVSGIASAGASIVSGVGSALSGIGRMLFKGREGGPRAVSNPQAIQGHVSSGSSLDSRVKVPMEQAFGVDFSHVRVHTDATAAGLSESLNARAFTIGRDVAFGPGEYQPGTLVGDALIAHELAHVVQQGGASSSESMLKGETTYTALEEDADRSAVGAMVSLWSGAKGRLVNVAQNAVPAMRSGLGLQRCASTPKQPVTGPTPTTVPTVDRSGTPTTTDQFKAAVTDPAANVLSNALSASERKRIRVITTTVPKLDVDDLFSTKGVRTTIPLPPNVTIRFAETIQNSLRHGLQNVAGELTQGVRITPAPLEINSTLVLALDLTQYGGDYAAFRFTYVEHRPPGGRPTREILVERLGSIGTEQMPSSQVKASQRKFEQHKFKRATGWDDSEYQSLLAAISQVPDSLLSPVDGITFRRESVKQSDPTAGGDYNPDTHTITIYDIAFKESITRFGVPGSGFSNEAVRSIIHELGHALDLLPLRQAWTKYEKSQGDKAAERALEAARSASGYRYRRNRQGTFETVEGGIGPGQNEFRQAARQDGNIRITHYSDEEWQEYFAEAFSIYIADPGSLRRLRPHVYEYFVRKYPR